jgi:hypothetical protein
MRHLQDEELVGLAFDELSGDERAACREHIQDCTVCATAFDGLTSAVALLEKEPTEPPPPFAWVRLKARVEQTGAGSDWQEPAWGPLILGNAAGIILVLTLIFLAGGWLEKASVWQAIRTWPLAAEVGPRSLAALVFFGSGALVTLALTPIFWWESRRPRKGIVK